MHAPAAKTTHPSALARTILKSASALSLSLSLFVRSLQLRLRVEASGGLAQGVLRPPSGSGRFDDLDQVRMLSLLESRESVLQNHMLFNQAMFMPEQSANPQIGGTRKLDAAWKGANGLRGLRYETRSRTDRSLSPDCTWMYVSVHLGGAQSS